MTSLLPEYVVLTFSTSDYESKLDQIFFQIRSNCQLDNNLGLNEFHLTSHGLGPFRCV